MPRTPPLPVGMPEIPDTDELARLRLDEKEAQDRISALRLELDAIGQRYRAAVGSRNFAGQSAVTGEIGNLPARIAEAECRYFGVVGTIAQREHDQLAPERGKAIADLNAAIDRLEQAKAERFAAGQKVMRIESRLGLLRDQARQAEERAATIAFEATELLGKDARRLLSVP